MPDIGQKCISTRWVIMDKYKDKRKIMKAHFVADIYEEDSNNLKTDSPICSYEAMHIIMLTASVIKWQVENLDFTSTSLQGDERERCFLDLHLTYIQSLRSGS